MSKLEKYHLSWKILGWYTGLPPKYIPAPEYIKKIINEREIIIGKCIVVSSLLDGFLIRAMQEGYHATSELAMLFPGDRGGFHYNRFYNSLRAHLEFIVKSGVAIKSKEGSMIIYTIKDALKRKEVCTRKRSNSISYVNMQGVRFPGIALGDLLDMIDERDDRYIITNSWIKKRELELASKVERG